MPERSIFGPLNGVFMEDNCILMTVDEYEAIRLIDREGLTQEESSQQMGIARTTVQGIYAEARKKIAQAIVEGKYLRITGGDYKLCEGRGKFCGHGCHRNRNRNRHGRFGALREE